MHTGKKKKYRKDLGESMRNSKDHDYTDNDILTLYNERYRNESAKYLADIQKVNPFDHKHFDGKPLKY